MIDLIPQPEPRRGVDKKKVYNYCKIFSFKTKNLIQEAAKRSNHNVHYFIFKKHFHALFTAKIET